MSVQQVSIPDGIGLERRMDIHGFLETGCSGTRSDTASTLPTTLVEADLFTDAMEEDSIQAIGVPITRGSADMATNIAEADRL